VEWKDLRAVRAALPHTPVYVGSGATPELIPDLLLYADGVIVGTAAKIDGDINNAVDAGRVRSLVRAARGSTGMTSMLAAR
jgi:predicted TIM-barrel enzyme